MYGRKHGKYSKVHANGSGTFKFKFKIFLRGTIKFNAGNKNMKENFMVV